MGTVLDFYDLLLVLSKVKTLGWEHLVTDGDLEVFVRDLTVTVKVELVENFLKFVF